MKGEEFRYMWQDYFFPNIDYEYLQLSSLGIINQIAVKGTATWTDGGEPTKCGIPWSSNNYLTTAVSTKGPYKCGQIIKVRNLSTAKPKEIEVIVVDTVQGFPANKLNLHKTAFEALGSPASIGVINIEILPEKTIEYAKWGKLLLKLAKDAFPQYDVVDYQFIGSQQIPNNQIRELFEFVLQSDQEKIKVRASVAFNSQTERIQSITFNELT